MSLHKNKAFSLIELSIVVLIIGILIAGITNYTSLVNKSRLSSARSLTQSSPVRSVKGLILWLETTSKDSFIESETQDSSLITKWSDLNPTVQQKNNAFARTPPTYKKNCLNGLPCLQFDGLTTYMETSYGIGRYPTFTIFAVFKPTGYQDNDRGDLVVSKNWGEPGDIWYYSNYYEEDEEWYLSLQTSEDYDKTGYLSGFRSVNVTSVVNKNSQYEIYVNKNAELLDDGYSEVDPEDITADLPPNIIQIGCFNEDSDTDPEAVDEQLNASVGEIIIFNRALKKQEREDIENYLMQKWGVKSKPRE
jgi:prepilin-type N-terminal cleavage/methylation domain-containing protein